MIFFDGPVKFAHITGPRKRPAILQIPGVRIIGESLQLEGIITVCDVMALTVHSSHEIEKYITRPVENEQHLNLLPEMDLLMTHKLCLIVWLTCYPDENKE